MGYVLSHVLDGVLCTCLAVALPQCRGLNLVIFIETDLYFMTAPSSPGIVGANPDGSATTLDLWGQLANAIARSMFGRCKNTFSKGCRLRWMYDRQPAASTILLGESGKCEGNGLSVLG